jgi:uncharacterized protein (TIGR02647 family)
MAVINKSFNNGNRTRHSERKLATLLKSPSLTRAGHCRRARFPGTFLEEFGAPMSYTPELIAELEILALFNLDNTKEGLKVHHTAAPSAIAAAQRLHDKGITTLNDGGYLTSLGLDAAEHAQGLLTILNVSETA